MEIINDYKGKVESASNGFSISIENLMRRGFDIFRHDPGNFILYGILTAVASSATILLGGPFTAGFYIVSDRITKKRPYEFNDFFLGFNKFLQLFVVNLLITLIVVLGLILLIIPGIYFAVSYLFAHFFVWFYDAEATEAIRLSRKMVSGNFGKILLLCLVLGLVNFLGALAFGVGLLITIPFSYCVVFAAFDDIIGIP